MSMAEKSIFTALLVMIVAVIGLGLLVLRLENRLGAVELAVAERPVAVATVARATVSPVTSQPEYPAGAVPVAIRTVAPPTPVAPAAKAAATSLPIAAAVAPSWVPAVGTLPTGATYYVTGTAAAGGNGTPAKPWREIRQAIPHLKPGDAVMVADGQYQGFTINGLHGTATAPIAFTAVGDKVELLPTKDRGDDRDTVFLNDCSHILFDGFRAFRGNRAAMRTEGGHHIAIRRCTFGNNATWGLFTGHTDDLLIDGNECFGSGKEHGIYVSNSAKRPVIRGNNCHDNAGCGIQINADLSCGPDGLTTGAEIVGNRCVNNGRRGGAAINLDGVQDSLIANNLLIGNHSSGIVSYKGDGAEGPRGNRFLYNTVVMARDSRYALQIGNTTGMNVVRNNILVSLNPARGSIAYNLAGDAANVDSDYNLFGADAAVVATDDWNTRTPLKQWQGNQREVHTLVAPALAIFTDLAANDFHLAKASPAIGAGEATAGVMLDLEGAARATVGAPDLGCYLAGK